MAYWLNFCFVEIFFQRKIHIIFTYIIRFIFKNPSNITELIYSNYAIHPKFYSTRFFYDRKEIFPLTIRPPSFVLFNCSQFSKNSLLFSQLVTSAKFQVKKKKKDIYLLLSSYALWPCSERSSNATSRTQHVSNKPKLRSFSMLMQIGTNNT